MPRAARSLAQTPQAGARLAADAPARRALLTGAAAAGAGPQAADFEVHPNPPSSPRASPRLAERGGKPQDAGKVGAAAAAPCDAPGAPRTVQQLYKKIVAPSVSPEFPTGPWDTAEEALAEINAARSAGAAHGQRQRSVRAFATRRRQDLRRHIGACPEARGALCQTGMRARAARRVLAGTLHRGASNTPAPWAGTSCTTSLAVKSGAPRSYGIQKCARSARGPAGTRARLGKGLLQGQLGSAMGSSAISEGGGAIKRVRTWGNVSDAYTHALDSFRAMRTH